MTDYANLIPFLRLLSRQGTRYGYATVIMADAADAIEELQQMVGHYEQSATDWWKEACEYKAQLPKHGEWKATEMYMTDECTACGFLMNWEDVPEWLFNLPHFKDRCPNCGAKMGVPK